MVEIAGPPGLRPACVEAVRTDQGDDDETSAFVWPFFPRPLITLLVAWGVMTGIFELLAATQLTRTLAAHWLVGTATASSIFLALVVLALPHAGSDRVA